jgi:4-amino-4-deoxy-L-arabinose transferase-like glycosyltransferase
MKNFEKAEIRKIWLVILIIFIIRILIAAAMNLVPDETYYWDWSSFLSLGYFDHPPMVAWLVFVTTTFFGDTFWAIKAVPLLGGLGIAIILFFLSKRYLTTVSSIIILLILANFTLVFAIGGLILTPDIPMVFFWTLGLLLAYQALFESKKWAWLALGIVAGLGLLSKYTFVLFGLTFFLFMLSDAFYRKLFLSWKPWIALILSVVVFAPNLTWNMQNNWISFTFQLGSRAGQPHFWKRVTYFLEYVGAEIGLLSPFVFIALIMATILILRKYLKNYELRFLLLFTYVPLLFFAIFSWRSRIEPNWPAPALISAILLVIWFWENSQQNRGKNRFINFAIIFSLFTTAIIVLHGIFPFLPIAAEKDRTSGQRGWKEFVTRVNEIRQMEDPQLKYPLIANSYQITSMLAFYSPDQPRTHSLNLYTRSNHYALLPGRIEALQDTIIFIAEFYKKEFPKDYLEAFKYHRDMKIIDREIGTNYSRRYGLITGLLRDYSD